MNAQTDNAVGRLCGLCRNIPVEVLRRVDSFRNILETGSVGLLFLIPGFGETLRVNGRAAIIRDEAWLAPLAAHGKWPLGALAVEVEECYLQCAKALLSSKLWKLGDWPNFKKLPSAAEMFTDQVRMPEFDVSKMQESLDSAYKDRLF
ncbi:MAG: hypothetical protein EA381_10075 [Planctomycetaceae bacterium]|nr:MAG: hypothetical protein EA381_10075 [Planctomycetaceae bacterium]